MPDCQTQTDNNFAISTDFIGQNWNYTEADYATRECLRRAHESWQKGLLWTYAHHPRVPEPIRLAFQRWSLARGRTHGDSPWRAIPFADLQRASRWAYGGGERRASSIS
jgi:hypothetical protein